MLDPQVCYRALEARDARFDGRFFVGVKTTGIYCRPVCSAGPARFESCRFLPSAAAAHEAGFRPCLRCRPETIYELTDGKGASSVVSRALALIAAGALDGKDGGVAALAARLFVPESELRQLFQEQLGASPVAVWSTRRVLFAKQLICETRLPMAKVAQAAGFEDEGELDEVFLGLFRRPPSALRRTSKAALSQGLDEGVTVELRYRAPFDWPAMLAYFEARAIEGVECVREGVYVRALSEHEQVGTIELRHRPSRESIAATVRFPSVAALSAIVARIRGVLDLDVDIDAIAAHLARDPLLGPLVGARPGLRVPHGWDGFEVAVRAILGQQVSVEAGRRLLGKLVQICGVPLAAPYEPSLTRAFPGPGRVLEADLSAMPMPGARKVALAEVAKAAVADPGLFEPAATVEATVTKLCAIFGIGEWTAHYIALRASREGDAFPAQDAGLLRSLRLRGVSLPAKQVALRAEPWRPWRAYAAQHLWVADAASRGASS